MNDKELKTILREHLLWLRHEGGERANLTQADLTGANLTQADLARANLTGAHLARANLTQANLTQANLTQADLTRANLTGANLTGADLTGANLTGANLTQADLTVADLTVADLTGANGIPLSKAYLSQFEKDESGIYVYKAIGNTTYNMPDYWKIESLSFIEEVVNPERNTECGCGVNFATMDWINKNYPKHGNVWKCLIHWEDVADVVVPFNTDGKARCARLQLIEKVSGKEE